jgi:digeranylgeranylglycerophospholipid reductase
MSIDDYLDRWQETDPRFADAVRLEAKQHRGSAHIQPPGSLSTDNFMAIGDTVPTVDPVWGEGINKCMKSGRAAAVAADHCLTPAERDTSAENLSVYDELWHAEVAPNADNRLLLTELLYLADNERYDRFMRDLDAADENTLKRANAGSRLAMLKLLHLSDLPILARLARQRMAA